MQQGKLPVSKPCGHFLIVPRSKHMEGVFKVNYTRFVKHDRLVLLAMKTEEWHQQGRAVDFFVKLKENPLFFLFYFWITKYWMGRYSRRLANLNKNIIKEFTTI